MNKKTNTICFILLFLFLICAVSAADSENETISMSQPNPNPDICQVSVDDEKLELPDEKEIPESSTGKVTKKKVTLKAPDVKMRYKDGTKFKVTLKDENKKAISKAKIKIKIDGSTYERTTDAKGIALLNLNMKSGTHNVITTFAGDNNYEKQSVKSTITVKSTIKCSDFSKYYKNTASYYSTFYDKKGKLLKDTAVKFKINSKTYSAKTNSKGVAKLAVDLKPGKYKISSVNLETTETVTKSLTIKTTVETKDLTMNESDGSRFKVKILNSYGKVSPNKKVTIKVNGKTYSPKTDEKGIASIPIDLDAGKYTITTEYNGIKNTNKLIVNKAIKHTPFSHVILIPNYVNVTTPYVFYNSAYALKTGFNGIIRMSKNELITVQVSENEGYLFSQAKIPGIDSIVIGYKTHLIPFDGSGIRSDYHEENLKGDGILISTDQNTTRIEYRNAAETNADMFGVYLDKGLGYSETITYMQNSKIKAKVNYQTYNYDENGLKYNLAKYYGKSIYDFNYKSYEDIIGDDVDSIKFAATGEPVEFSYFGNSIAGYLSREDIITKFIANGIEELERKETITYGLSESYNKNLAFEVLQSYAIINEKIEESHINSKLSKKSAYLNVLGVMNVYGMFLAGLETVWLADEFADAYAKDFKVNWKRTNTTTILGGINLEDTYLHVLNADMGMHVTGSDKNTGLFKLVNSLNLPNIEEYVLEPVAKRFGANTTNSLNNVFAAAKNNFSMVQLGEMLYVFNNADSAIVLNTTSGVCSVILNHGNAVYKGSQVSTCHDCCSVAAMPKDIIAGIQDSINHISSGIGYISNCSNKIHPLSTMGYNIAKYILGSALTGAAALAHGLLSTMVFIQATGTTFRNRMIEEKDWHAIMDKITFTRPGYLQSKKIYNIPNENGGTDYIEVSINDNLTLDRNDAKYISEGKTKQLTKEETYQYFSEDYWTPFSMPSKYWDKSWRE